MRDRAGAWRAGSSTGPKHTARFCGVMRLWAWKEETRRRWSRRRVSVACGEDCEGGHEASKVGLPMHLRDTKVAQNGKTEVQVLIAGRWSG
jgi:hypothetical protein